LNLGIVSASTPPPTVNCLIVAGEYPTICSRRQVRGLGKPTLGEPTLGGRVRDLLGDCGTTVSPLISLVVVC